MGCASRYSRGRITHMPGRVVVGQELDKRALRHAAAYAQAELSIDEATGTTTVVFGTNRATQQTSTAAAATAAAVGTYRLVNSGKAMDNKRWNSVQVGCVVAAGWPRQFWSHQCEMYMGTSTLSAPVCHVHCCRLVSADCRNLST
jgi:hypothetical protein